MSAEGKARQRCISFSGEEKLLIANTCAKYKHVLENKKTDNISNDQKNKIWEKIAAEVNAAALNATYRTPEILKRFYENRKREVRKIAAEEKKDIFATEGGQSKIFKKDVCHDIILSIMNPKTVCGLENEFDGDAEPEPTTAKPNTEADTSFQQSQFCEDVDVAEEIVYELDKNEEGEATWKKYIPANLKAPINPKLTKFEHNLQPSGSSKRKNNDEEANDYINTPQIKKNKPYSVSRRRPTMQIKALTRSEIAEKYDQLLDKRLKIAEFQMQKLEEGERENSDIKK